MKMNYWMIKTRLHAFKFVFPLLISLWIISPQVQAQTDFAPGQIMFTGYTSDAPDMFSIVLLTDVVSGTVIYITDRGWSNANGFRVDATGEGTISYTFANNYPCGTVFIFTDIGVGSVWQATNIYGVVVGTVAIVAGGDADGMELFGGFFSGDQLLIYQLPEPTSGNQSSFVCMIQMDNSLAGSVNEDWESELPSGLTANTIVRFNTERENAKYDCNPNMGTSAVLQAAITNDNGSGGLIADNSNNWAESNNFINQAPGCTFCCGNTIPGTPVLSGENQLLPNQTFTLYISGTLAPGASWELYTAGCGVGSPLQTTTSNFFTITAPGTTGGIIYYVRSSEMLDCAGFCGILNACVIADLYTRCTTCSADPLVCGDCFLPAPATNPALDSGCYSIRLIFILDESGSIGGNQNNVRDGVLAFLNALNGQNIEAALIEFSYLGQVVNDYTIINDEYIGNITNYFNGIDYNFQTYLPSGGTNWHDAMLKADVMANPDIVLFFTDGEPTGFTQTNGTDEECSGWGSTETPEIVNPVKLANKFKREGTHMFMLGVGDNIVQLNLQRMSGPIEYVVGTNTMGTSDYSIGNFDSLAVDLENFVLELCQTRIELQKDVLGPICDGKVTFRFRVINRGTESSATNLYVTDTFPAGYNNPVYNGPPTKLCIGAGCNPPIPANAFIWNPQPIPPGDTAELLITVNVLGNGLYTNYGWAWAENADIVGDTFPGNLIVPDLVPSITCPANVTIQCSASTLPGNTGTPSGIDPDGPPPTMTYVDVTAAGSCPQAFTITRTWTATDTCNNTATCIQIITIRDDVPPVMTCAPNITIACQTSTLPAATGTTTATDACNGVPVITYSDVTQAGGCIAEYTIFRTWNAVDPCGNASSCVQQIFLDDSLPPNIICAFDVTIGCTDSTLPINTGSTKVQSHNCGGTATITYVDDYFFQVAPPICRILRTWTVTDDCGNSVTCLQTISISDSVLPVITCPANVTISCTANTLPANTGTASATDNCDLNPTITYTDAITNSPICIQEYTITRTWKATDDCGNTSTTCIQTILVDDSSPPAVSCPPNITIQCTSSTLPAATGTATSTDNCTPSPVITYSDVTTASPTCPQEYTIVRTWIATDACTNSSTCVQTIVIDDSTSPVITCPPNITIQCNAVTLPENTGLATATDNCDPTPVITFTDVTTSSPTCSQEYSIVRTFKATDDCGNTSTCTQSIVLDDSTSPVITCPVDITIDCTVSTLPGITGSATATDNCDVTPTITFTDVTLGGGCPQAYLITRTWKATDDCGNTSTCAQAITVQDTTAPVITCPADITIECTASTLPVNTGSATATDNCDLVPTITYSDVTTASETCPQEYMLARTWTVVDDCGNSSTCIQTIVVDDSTSPVITCPADVTIECTAETLPVNTGSATATDNCDGAPVITYNDITIASETCPQEYFITRTWTATDACGNTSTCNQMIVIDDSLVPAIICPANTTIECTASTLPENTGSATATDNCDTSPEVTYSDVTLTSETCPQIYSISRTWTATDTCDNSSSCVQLINIIDSTPPMIVCPPDLTLECFEITLPINTGTATATDNCDASPLVTYSDVTIQIPETIDYLRERTWIATDACGNQDTCIQTITFINLLDPEILGDATDTICSGESVSFEADDPGIVQLIYEWTFGSGSNPFSAMGDGPHSVQYTYNGTNGTTGAWVLLTLSAPGCVAVTDTVANIHVNAKPNTAISFTPSNPCVLTNMTFQPQVPEMAGFTYMWTFGTGASIPSAIGYGPHTLEYYTQGSKMVKLVIFSNEAGASCGDSTTITFTVNLCPGNITGGVFKSDGTPIGAVNIRLFADQNLNGIADGAALRSVFTTGLGTYSMAAVTPGYYILTQIQPSGYFSLYDEDTTEDFDSLSNWDPNDNIIPLTVEPTEYDENNNFYEVTSPGIISGYVFEDFNSNQSPDGLEGIHNVTIELHADNVAPFGIADPGGWIANTTTSTIGFYTFGGLTTGNFVLVEQQPAGFNSVKDFDPTNDGDVYPNTNMMDDSIPLTLTNAETDAQNFFIDISPCSGVVTNTADGVPGSLRYMIDCVEEGDTVRFHSSLSGLTIYLTDGRIEIDKNLYLHSDVIPRIMIQSNVNGAFKILQDKVVEVKNLNITSGLSGFQGAAFDNFGQLTLWDVFLYRNILLPVGDYLIFNGMPGTLTVKGTIQVQSN